MNKSVGKTNVEGRRSGREQRIVWCLTLRKRKDGVKVPSPLRWCETARDGRRCPPQPAQVNINQRNK